MQSRNLPAQGFPSHLKIKENDYQIYTSYRIVWAWLDMMDNEFIGSEMKLFATLELFFVDEIPEDLEIISESYTKLQEWLLCGYSPDVSSSKKLYDFNKDYYYIWGAFKANYNIDLNVDIHMHWWEFKSRFEELPDKSQIKKIISIRDMPIPKPGADDWESTMRAKSYFSLDR